MKYEDFHLRLWWHRYRDERTNRWDLDRTSIVKKKKCVLGEGSRNPEGWNLKDRVLKSYNITKSLNELGIKESVRFWGIFFFN